MISVYAPTYRAVKTAQALENSVFEGRDQADTLEKLSALSSTAYDAIRRTAEFRPVAAGLSKKEAMAARVAEVALSLHAAHQDLGAKTAAAPDHLAAIIQKLATAVFVDEVLLEQLSMLEGDTKIAAEQCQRLGREYIMSLLGEILP